MDLDPQIILFGMTVLGSVAGGAAWVGRIHQRVNTHEQVINEMKQTLTAHVVEATKAHQTVAGMSGKVDILFEKLMSE